MFIIYSHDIFYNGLLDGEGRTLIRVRYNIFFESCVADVYFYILNFCLAIVPELCCRDSYIQT